MMKKTAQFLFLIISIFLVFQKGFAQNLKIDINKGHIEPLPIAIANFTDKNGKFNKIGNLISSVITNNLVSSGQFKAADEAAFIAPSNPDIRPILCFGAIPGRYAFK